MSETGHAKNIAEFETLANFITNLGTLYQPSKDDLKLANLNSLLTDARNSLSQTQHNFSQWKDVTNQRETAFADSGKLAVRVVNAFAVSGADNLDISDAKSFVRKMQGRRAKEKAAPTTPGEAVKTHSASQTSYDNKVQHFAQLVSILENNSQYKPNEADLKTATLTTVLDDQKHRRRQFECRTFQRPNFPRRKTIQPRNRLSPHGSRC